MSDELATPSLGPLEQKVMHLLWDHGPLTIREVIDRLPQEPAYTTIATVLRHLARKDLVRVVKDGRTARHQAQLSREEYTAGVMDNALSASRNRSASILHFVKSMDDSDRELLLNFFQDKDAQS